MNNYRKVLASLMLVCLVLISGLGTCSSTIYRIKTGDTLSQIARNFGVLLDKLININDIKNPDVIRVGQVINIPGEFTEYRIKSGDTLARIATKFKVELSAIVRANSIKNADKIIAGKVLMIPVKSRKTTPVSRQANPKINFLWPAQGSISSAFGYRKDPFTGERKFHTGIDIAIPVGSPVHASAGGVVTFSGEKGGYGQLIIIQHRNNYQTYYAHNINLLVKKGEQVSQGKVIAVSGSSGRSTGPHLHFEIRKDNRVDNPMVYLNQQYRQNGFQIRN